MAKSWRVTLVVVRTGPSTWDLEGRLAGRADIPLAESARAEIDATVERARALAGPEGLWGVICGPDEASWETAGAIGAAAEVKPRRLDGLAEVSLGLWDGSLRTSIEERCPSVYRRWCEDPTGVDPPEGEPLRGAAERLVMAVVRAAERARREETGALCVVLKPMAWSLVMAVIEGRGLSLGTGLGGAGLGGAGLGGAGLGECSVEAGVSVHQIELERLRRSVEPAGIGS